MLDLVLPAEGPLPGFDGGREYLLVIGEEEVRLSPGRGLTLEWQNNDALSRLQAEDFLTARLILNGDPDNFLWQWAFEAGPLVVNSSEDRGSRLNKSFIICNSEGQGAAPGGGDPVCSLQQPIIVELNTTLQDTDVVEWQVEAADEKYGKTQRWIVGENMTNVNHHVSVASPTASGNGAYGNPWRSKPFTGTAGRFLSFSPDMADDPHEPAVYTRITGGTRGIDQASRNPMVAYKITAKLNGQDFSTRAKIDEVDAIRQEYINHNLSARKEPGREFVNIPVPERDEIVATSSVPAGFVVPGYPYRYLVDDTMTQMSGQIMPTLNQGTGTLVGAFAGTVIDTLDIGQYRVSSGYRNPERNEAVGGASCSAHMRGRAIDIALAGGGTGFAGEPNAQAMAQIDKDKALAAKRWYAQWSLAVTTPPATARMMQLEYAAGQALLRVTRPSGAWGSYANGFAGSMLVWQAGSVLWEADRNEDDVPDIFMFGDHLHIQSQFGTTEQQCTS